MSIDSVSELLREGFFDEADRELDFLLEKDCHSELIISAMKAVGFWKEKMVKFFEYKDKEHFQKGDYLVKQWINFCHYFTELKALFFNELSGLRLYIFHLAVMELKKIDSVLMDADCMIDLGRCYRLLGDYESGLSCLETAFRKRRNDAGIMAELADCYSLANQEKMAKVFFREAFFIDPDKVELTFIDSPIIVKMIEKISEKEYDDRTLKYWIPVYGTIFGVFNIKRELKPVELGKLKQAIFLMEQQDSTDESIVKAKLLNHYFWLIDHIRSSIKERGIEGRETIDELLQKIKRLDKQIYLEYTK